MTEEKGCWNCKHEELDAHQEPCHSCVFYDPALSKWERGSQVLFHGLSRKGEVEEYAEV